MKRLIVFATLALMLALAPCVHAQQLQVPGGVIGGSGCTWTVTVFGGAATQTGNAACLAQYSHVWYANAAAGGTPTAVITPGQAGTTPAMNVVCAITAPGSTTVGCQAPAGAPTQVIYGFGW